MKQINEQTDRQIDKIVKDRQMIDKIDKDRQITRKYTAEYRQVMILHRLIDTLNIKSCAKFLNRIKRQIDKLLFIILSR